MRKSVVCVFAGIAILFIITGSCKKKTTPPPPPPPTEATLAVTLTPPVNSVQPAAPQTDFPLTVSITSTMPAQGVTIVISAKKDDGSGAAAFFNSSTNSSIANNSFTITGTPTNVVCLTTVTVTSVSKPTNTWTGSYRYSRKP
ncbi:MAG TPA: hypothetical protein VI548_00530 [Chitinophagaceae bacterium]|nr:hypothetical protein [Chitinophagaceae bacterium]